LATFHKGELDTQSRAGLRTFAAQVGRSIRDFISPSGAAFLPLQRLAVVASVAADGGLWASALVGPPGFLSVPDLHTLQIAAGVHSDDPLWRNLQHNRAVGVLIIDLAARRRLRVNGKAELTDAGMLVRVEQVYSNCPQYIQQRVPEPTRVEAGDRRTTQSAGLSASQREWIARADTFFIATAHPEAGADASHRGGMPGFVHFLGDDKLIWPDYTGNAMLQSLGNLASNPHAGLLFVDFAAGRALQLTGEAHVVWDERRAAEFPGAERLVEFTAKEVLQTESAFSERWHFVEYSPVNPQPR